MIHARPVRGAFRTLRTGTNAVLVTILVALPWIRVAGEPLVLLDVPARRFHVFGLVIFPQELYFLWLLLACLALCLFFFTSLAGRLWCGWACPQTVFTDLFAGIARAVEGWSKGFRRPRHVARWRVALKHIVWFSLCVFFAFHFVGYFRSPYEMLAEMRSGDLSGTTAGFLGAMTALLWADFVVVRQTFCRYLCPYARFQGVLFDRDTLVVGYDESRGEPRGRAARQASAPGDCVDCGLCVQVCPTEIDIRDGLQLECIACTQCIDACDGVMRKLDRAPGLIAYRSLASLEGEGPARLARPRVLAYGALLAATVVAFAGLLAERKLLDLEVVRNRSALTTSASDGRVGNAFTLRIHNRSRQDARYALRLEPADRYELIAGLNPVPVPATRSTEARVFVLRSEDAPTAEAQLEFFLEPVDAPGPHVVRRVPFVDTASLLPSGDPS